MSQHGYRNWFQLHQYDYMHQGNRIGVEPGDVVIDGGCWGDTAIYFADRAAPGGRVYTFEFAPENTTVLRMNIESNPKLADRIIPVENALSDVDGKQMEYSMSGPAARIGNTLSVTGRLSPQAWTNGSDGNSLEELTLLRWILKGRSYPHCMARQKLCASIGQN